MSGPVPPDASAGADGWLERRLPIVNVRGLHARASAKFAACAERFESEITVSRAGETVNAFSIMGLLTLAAAQGTAIDVRARGADAQAALDALDALVATRFGEDE